MGLTAVDKQAVRDWDLYYKNFLAEVSVDTTETEAQQKERIKRLEDDFEEWKKYYFPKYCFAPAAPFHEESSAYALSHPESVIVRRWSRELAKDVVTMMETLYQALASKKERQKKCIMLISNSYDKAADFLEPYKINLEKNERIINDYGVQQLPGSWASGGFITTQGVAFYAFGAGQSPRGLRNEEIRPDKAIFTDVDTDEDVRNPDTIEKRFKWAEKAVYATRSISKNFQIVWLNNTIAKDCCVVRASERADRVEIINVMDENGQSTWPGKNTLENIARLKKTMSTAAFEAEYMNNPISEGSVFKNCVYGQIPKLSSFKYLVIYGDPAPGENKTKKSSGKAVILLGKKNGILYVIKGFVGKGLNSIFIGWYYELIKWVAGRVTVYCYMENNKLQDPFFKQVFTPLIRKANKKYGMKLNIKGDVEKKTDKATRIDSNLEPLDRDGELIFNEAEKDNPHMEEIRNQFKMFELTMPYDVAAPDTIEGGNRILDQKQAELQPKDTIDRKTINKRNKHRR